MALKADLGRERERTGCFQPLIHRKKRRRKKKVKPLAVAHKPGEAEGKCQCHVTAPAGTRQLLDRDVRGLFGIMYPLIHKLRVS